jgi:ATP-dependent Clp protease adaptor protein ClpS
MTTQIDDSTLLEREVVKAKPPAKYAVVLLNDDFTPMDFVIRILQECFNKGESEAEQITILVHVAGRGPCGVFTKEVAETKVDQVSSYAIDEGHPLKCVMEEV